MGVFVFSPSTFYFSSFLSVLLQSKAHPHRVRQGRLFCGRAVFSMRVGRGQARVCAGSGRSVRGCSCGELMCALGPTCVEGAGWIVLWQSLAIAMDKHCAHRSACNNVFARLHTCLDPRVQERSEVAVCGHLLTAPDAPFTVMAGHQQREDGRGGQQGIKWSGDQERQRSMPAAQGRCGRGVCSIRDSQQYTAYSLAQE